MRCTGTPETDGFPHPDVLDVLHVLPGDAVLFSELHVAMRRSDSGFIGCRSVHPEDGHGALPVVEDAFPGAVPPPGGGGQCHVLQGVVSRQCLREVVEAN